MIGNLALASALALAPAITDKKTNTYKANQTERQGTYNQNNSDINLDYETVENSFIPFYLKSVYIRDHENDNNNTIGGYNNTYSIYTFEKRQIATPTYDFNAVLNYMLYGRDNYTDVNVKVTIKISYTNQYETITELDTNNERLNYINNNSNWLATIYTSNDDYQDLWEDTYYKTVNSITALNSNNYYTLMIKIESTLLDETNIQTSYAGIEGTFTYYEQPIEVIDLPGLMFTILGMPFAFISQAFNLTLFPGTQYAVNVSNIIFAIIVGLLLILIVKKVIK